MANVSGEKMVVFDLSECRIKESPSGTSVTLLAPSGELLALLDTRQSWSDRESALRLYDTCLASGFVWRDDSLHKVSLWNPYTRMAAVDPLPETLSFSLDVRTLPKTGLPVLVFPDRMCARGEVFLSSSANSFAALSRDLEAHLR
jgi:hypothetical protein